MTPSIFIVSLPKSRIGTLRMLGSQHAQLNLRGAGPAGLCRGSCIGGILLHPPSFFGPLNLGWIFGRHTLSEGLRRCDIHACRLTTEKCGDNHNLGMYRVGPYPRPCPTIVAGPLSTLMPPRMRGPAKGSLPRLTFVLGRGHSCQLCQLPKSCRNLHRARATDS